MLAAHSSACTKRSRCLRIPGASSASHSRIVRISSAAGSGHGSLSDFPEPQYASAASFAVVVVVALGPTWSPSPLRACFAKNHVVKQNLSVADGSTLWSVFAEENSTTRPAIGSTLIGSSGNGNSTSSPPSPGFHVGFRYVSAVTTLASSPASESKCSGKHPPRPALRCSLTLW